MSTDQSAILLVSPDGITTSSARSSPLMKVKGPLRPREKGPPGLACQPMFTKLTGDFALFGGILRRAHPQLVDSK